MRKNTNRTDEMTKKSTNRCPWAGSDPLYLDYHDREWGTPLFDDRKLFEFLVLEGMQAGLSWLTILRKRENFRKRFDNFNPAKISRYDEKKLTALLSDAGIIRNRRKIESAVNNATAFLRVRREFGSFSDYLWAFVDHRPVINSWRDVSEIPAWTARSEKMSRDLKKRGFTFVGPTICYAYMQAAGLVNDHSVDCFRYHELKSAHP